MDMNINNRKVVFKYKINRISFLGVVIIVNQGWLLIIRIMFLVSGIFVYLNFLTPRNREEIIKILINGLKRLEYRGYDSAGKFFYIQNF